MNPTYTLIVHRLSTSKFPNIGEFKVHESLPVQGLITRAIELLTKAHDLKVAHPHSHVPDYNLGVIIVSNEGTFFQNLTANWMFGHNILDIWNDKPPSLQLIETWETIESTIKTSIQAHIAKTKLQNA